MEIRRETGVRLLTFATLSVPLEMLVLLYYIDGKKQKPPGGPGGHSMRKAIN